jgi:intein/homing endonuclease
MMTETNLNLNNLLDDLIGKLEVETNDTDWREQPVDLMTFFTSPDFLGETPYPGKQTELIEIVDHVIRKDDDCPDELLPVNELILMLGKGCLHGDTRIVDAVTGTVYTAEELYKQNVPFAVKSFNEDTQTLVNSISSGVVRAGKGDIYEVVTNSGRKIKVFDQHQFLTRKRAVKQPDGKFSGLEWKKLSDLKVNDYIAVSNAAITGCGVNIDPNIAKLAGYLIGGGYIDSDWQCSFRCSNDDAVDDYCGILRTFGINPAYSTMGQSERSHKTVTATLKSSELQANGGKWVMDLLKAYWSQDITARNKYIPREFMNMSRSSIIDFMGALFATGGWACIYRNNKPQVGYYSLSRQLVEDMQFMLAKIGIYSRVDAKTTDCGAAYNLTINTWVDTVRFCNTINIVGKTRGQQTILNAANGNDLGLKKDADIYFDRIKSITYVGTDDYYDLTVNQYANYVAEGFINHNSGKDFLASAFLAYMCYRLCCLKNPQSYYKFGQDEPIDLINMSVNAYQANNVFFKKFKARIQNCKWFKKVNYPPQNYNEYQITKNQVRFYKNITAHSAHSEVENFEGFNPLFVIFDEIGEYKFDNAETAYTTMRSSAISRFNDQFIMMFISYPRSEDDYMMYKYHEWEKGDNPHIYAMRAASWEVNLRMNKSLIEKEYQKDPEGSRAKYESLVADTKIMTSRGLRNIADVRKGDFIHTPYGTREVLDVMVNGVKKVYKVTTTDGYYIRGSALHPVKMADGRWNKIEDLYVGDKIALDFNNQLFGDGDLSVEICKLLAGLAASGYIEHTNGVPQKVILHFPLQLRGYAFRLAVDFENEFGVAPSINVNNKQIMLYSSTQDVLSVFAGLYDGKDIPDIIFEQPKEQVLAFIKTIVDIGGQFKSNGVIVYVTSYNNIAVKLQQLLLMVGVKSTLTQKRPDRVVKYHRLDTKPTREQFILSIDGCAFNKVIRSDIAKNRQIQDYVGTYDSVDYTVVADVEADGEESLYDLYVEPEHEFVANGIVVHNCIPPKRQEGFFQFAERIDDCIAKGVQNPCIVEQGYSAKTLNSGEEKFFKTLNVYNLSLDPNGVYYLGGDAGINNDSYSLSLWQGIPTPIEVVENNVKTVKWMNKPVEVLLLKWEPDKANRMPVDILNVDEFLKQLCSVVYIKKALFDQFNSAETIQLLQEYGVQAEDRVFSNAFQMQIYSNLKRLVYTNFVELLDFEEDNNDLKALRLINGNKIDHDDKHSKDSCDARAAGIWLVTNDEPELIEHFSMPVIVGAKRKG